MSVVGKHFHQLKVKEIVVCSSCLLCHSSLSSTSFAEVVQGAVLRLFCELGVFIIDFEFAVLECFPSSICSSNNVLSTCTEISMPNINFVSQMLMYCNWLAI